MVSCTLCEPWSAHKAHRLGLVQPNRSGARGRTAEVIPNPLVVTDRWVGDRVAGWCYGEPLGGDDKIKRPGRLIAEARRGEPRTRWITGRG